MNLENNYREELRINPFVKKEGQKYTIVQVTDIRLHSSIRRETKSIGKIAEKHQETNTPYRAYAKPKDWNVPRESQKEMIIDMLKSDQSYIDFVKKQEEQGYKVLLSIPYEIPILYGEDTIEFINSKRGQRIVRRIAKEKD